MKRAELCLHVVMGSNSSSQACTGFPSSPGTHVHISTRLHRAGGKKPRTNNLQIQTSKHMTTTTNEGRKLPCSSRVIKHILRYAKKIMDHCISKIALSAGLKNYAWCVWIVIFLPPVKPWEIIYAKDQEVKAASAIFCLINTGIQI